MESETTSQNIRKNKKGMPSGIPFIIGNEAAERFSYYGMKAILIVFMVDFLRMPENQATEWYHNFGSAVYALPFLGALVADLFLGKYRTILWLSLVYCVGHLVLALYETQEGLLIGLSLIAFGSGGIKPCVSAHVGDQFGESNKDLIPKVFNFFYFAVNFGAFFSTLATPFLLKTYGPSIAFGIPGALMFLATFIFWLGRKRFVHIAAKPRKILNEFGKVEFWSLIVKLLLLYLFVGVFWSLFDQTGSSWVLQAKSDLMNKTVNLGFVEFEILPSQIGSANPILVLVLIPVFTFIIYPLIKKKFEFSSLKRINAGFFIASASFFIMAYVEGQMYEGQIMSVGWQILGFLILTIGEVLVSITALEYSYSKAPNSLKSIIMSVYLFSVSFGNQIASQVNKFMVEDFLPTEIRLQNDNLAFTSERKFTTGDKVNINQDLDLYLDKAYKAKEDTLLISGTYLVQASENNGNLLLDPKTRKPLKVKLRGERLPKLDEAAFSFYKLNGPAYFKFFAWLMFITAIIFIPFALKMKTKTYVQESQG